MEELTPQEIEQETLNTFNRIGIQLLDDNHPFNYFKEAIYEANKEIYDFFKERLDKGTTSFYAIEENTTFLEDNPETDDYKDEIKGLYFVGFRYPDTNLLLNPDNCKAIEPEDIREVFATHLDINKGFLITTYSSPVFTGFLDEDFNNNCWQIIQEWGDMM